MCTMSMYLLSKHSQTWNCPEQPRYLLATEQVEQQEVMCYAQEQELWKETVPTHKIKKQSIHGAFKNNKSSWCVGPWHHRCTWCTWALSCHTWYVLPVLSNTFSWAYGPVENLLFYIFTCMMTLPLATHQILYLTTLLHRSTHSRVRLFQSAAIFWSAHS